MKIDKQKLYALYEAGYSEDEIARQCGCTKNYTQDLIHRKYGKRPKYDTGKINALWKAGWSINSIMSEMNLTEEEIRKAVFG